MRPREYAIPYAVVLATIMTLAGLPLSDRVFVIAFIPLGLAAIIFTFLWAASIRLWTRTQRRGGGYAMNSILR